MANKKMKKEILSAYKKDTNGLFDGGYRSTAFDTKQEKEDRRRKRTNELLNEALFSEDFIEDEDEY